MKLGPNQKKWIADLRAFPERQTGKILGKKTDNGIIKACCLGQAILTVKGEQVYWDNTIVSVGKEYYDEEKNTWVDTWENNLLTEEDASLLGLRDGEGSFKESVYLKDGSTTYYNSLANMNDEGVSWLEIADYLEAHPENVFVKSA